MGYRPEETQVVRQARSNGSCYVKLVITRELGLNPDKLGKIDNHKQEAWKAPLPQFMTGLEILFNVDLGKYYRTYTSMRGRGGGMITIKNVGQ